MAEERLQKILSERGVASRRKAEELIANGKVKVNGHIASLGDKADPRRDTILVSGRRLAQAEEPTYILLHKPRGVVTTMSDELGRRCVAELVRDVGVRVYPVGRLDRDSEGMLLMTNDGDFANAITHPSNHMPKRYRVTVRGTVPDETLEAFRGGMELDGRLTLPADISVVTAEPSRTVLEIVLYEGRNRQIRRMCEARGLEVARLRRVAIGAVKLGVLPAGQWRHLTPREVKLLVQATGVPQKVAAAYIKKGSVPRDPHSGRR